MTKPKDRSEPLVPEGGPAMDTHRLDATRRPGRPSDVIGDDLLDYFVRRRWARSLLGLAAALGGLALFIYLVFRLAHR
jgi:hypothetical protein